MRHLTATPFIRLTILTCAFLMIAGCGSQKARRDGVYSGEKNVGDVVGAMAIRGERYTVYKISTPIVFKIANLGVPDDEIPKELRMSMFVYTLSKEGANVGITGIFPNHISADLRKSTVIIPKRHVDKLLKSSDLSATFTITDP